MTSIGEKFMSSSLRALLAGAIDYAGLFPPAQLPLDQAPQAYQMWDAKQDQVTKIVLDPWGKAA